MYTLQVKRKSAKRLWSRLWWGWESPDGAAPSNQFYLISHIPYPGCFKILKWSVSLSGLFNSLWVPATERRRCEPKGHERQRPPPSRHVSGAHWVRDVQWMSVLLIPGLSFMSWQLNASAHEFRTRDLNVPGFGRCLGLDRSVAFFVGWQ